MSTRTTLILLVIVAVLGGYVWWSGRGSTSPAASATPETLTVWSVDPGQVQAIAVQPSGQPGARVERE
ncbi:MAG TPA: hypothetical protein DEP84_31630, partial [Chloroflexi bacterium]|nr:hypothetical protein [Chloroflexota bacterium]